jgi:hypothetical protein
MWKKRLSTWRYKRLEECAVEGGKTRMPCNESESMSSMTTVLSAFDDISFTSRQQVECSDFLENDQVFRSSFLRSNRLSILSSDDSLSELEAFDFGGETLDQINQILHQTEFEELYPISYSREKLKAQGFCFAKSKLVRMLSSSSLKSEGNLEDRNTRSEQLQENSLFASITTHVTYASRDSESDIAKMNELNNCYSRLTEKLEHSPKIELFDKLLDLNVKLKKRKKSKKKKSSRRERLVSDLK